eukprot:SAG31_NODE_669_length_12945_cov_4.141912_5_plen_489_part_00
MDSRKERIRVLVLDKRAPLSDVTFEDGQSDDDSSQCHVVTAIGRKAAKAFPELAVGMVLDKVAGKRGGWQQADVSAASLLKWLDKNVGRPMELQFLPLPKPEEPPTPKAYAHLKLGQVRQKVEDYSDLTWMYKMAHRQPIDVKHNGQVTTYCPPRADFGPYMDLRRPLAARHRRSGKIGNGAPYSSPNSPESPQSPDFFKNALSQLAAIESTSTGKKGPAAIIEMAREPPGQSTLRQRHNVAIFSTAVTSVLESARQLLEAAHSGRLQLLREALAAGADPNTRKQRSNGRWTALMVAAVGGHRNCVRALVGAGANVNSTATGGVTALHLAAAHARTEVVSALLRAGADPNKIMVIPGGSSGAALRPRDLAAKRGAFETACVIDIFQADVSGASLAATVETITSGWDSFGGGPAQLHDLIKRRRAMASLKDVRAQAGSQAYALFQGEVNCSAIGFLQSPFCIDAFCSTLLLVTDIGSAGFSDFDRRGRE